MSLQENEAVSTPDDFFSLSFAEGNLENLVPDLTRSILEPIGRTGAAFCAREKMGPRAHAGALHLKLSVPFVYPVSPPLLGELVSRGVRGRHAGISRARSSPRGAVCSRSGRSSSVALAAGERRRRCRRRRVPMQLKERGRGRRGLLPRDCCCCDATTTRGGKLSELREEGDLERGRCWSCGGRGGCCLCQ